MQRLIASAVLVALVAASPVHAAPSAPSTTTASAPTEAPAAVEGPAPAPEVAPAPAPAPPSQELLDVRNRHRKARLATMLLLGLGGGLVIVAGSVASGYTRGAVGETGLFASFAMAGVGGGVLLTALVPGVIAIRAKKRAAALERPLALVPGGWVNRGSAGASLSLRF